jgi:glutamine cyclotransferase
VLGRDVLEDCHVSDAKEKVAMLVDDTSKRSGTLALLFAKATWTDTDSLERLRNESFLVIVSNARYEGDFSALAETANALSCVSGAAALCHDDFANVRVVRVRFDRVTLANDIDCCTTDYRNWSSSLLH